MAAPSTRITHFIFLISSKTTYFSNAIKSCLGSCLLKQNEANSNKSATSQVNFCIIQLIAVQKLYDASRKGRRRKSKRRNQERLLSDENLLHQASQ